MADRHGFMNRSLVTALCLLAAHVSFAAGQSGPRATSKTGKVVAPPLGTPVVLPGLPVVATDSAGPDAGPSGSADAATFSLAQLQYDRVRDARAEVRYGIKKLFRDRGLRYPAADIYMRVFKREHALELWVRPEGDTIFSLLRTYEICAQSGELGPKRGKGDNQVPEGFYTIDRFNPYSDYHLSLHVDYPNRSDQLISTQPDLGGDIMIHGGCNSIGCLALTDEGIKQLYWVAVEARTAGQQRIPIDIYPSRLDDENFAQLSRVFAKSPALVNFWRTLKPGFDFFEKKHILPTVRVDAIGHYIINNMSLPGTSVTAVGADAPLGRAIAPLGRPVEPLGTPVDSTVANGATGATGAKKDAKPAAASKTKKPVPVPLGVPVGGGHTD
jgi:murein L,D-transpeptidase YafK